MGHANRLSADAAGLADTDIAQLVDDRLAPPGARPGPIHGFVTRHGQTMPFTLDTSRPLPAPPGIMPEQVAIAALVLASFAGAIFRLVG